jgi:hypothetical protein
MDLPFSHSACSLAFLRVTSGCLAKITALNLALSSKEIFKFTTQN